MKGKISLVFILLMISLPCRGQNFEVKSVKNGSVNIKNGDSGQTVKAKVGDTLENGWTVVLIRNDAVIIEKWIGEEEKIQGILPINQMKLEKK